MQKKTKRKILGLFGAALAICGTLTSAFAEELQPTNTAEPIETEPTDNDTPIFEEKDVSKMPVIEDKTGNLTFKYYDDADETIPVEQATFEVYQIAEYGRDLNNNGALLPLDESIDYHDQMDAYAYADSVAEAYEKNADLGYFTTVTIENGTAEITDMPVGAYLIVETVPAEYHIKSIPFIASVPEMNETSDSWNFDVTVEPKAQIAGHVSLIKKVAGNASNTNDVFDFQLNIADGEYKALLPNNVETTVKNGDVIQLKANQQIIIYNLPEQSEYSLKEINLENTGYVANYENAEGKVVGKTITSAVITNKKDNTETSVRNNTLIYIECGVGALALLTILLIAKKKKNKKEN